MRTSGKVIVLLGLIQLKLSRSIFFSNFFYILFIYSKVVRYVQSLLSGCASLTTSDIGLIAPYRKQVEKIRLLLAKTGIEDIKVTCIRTCIYMYMYIA